MGYAGYRGGGGEHTDFDHVGADVGEGCGEGCGEEGGRSGVDCLDACFGGGGVKGRWKRGEGEGEGRVFLVRGSVGGGEGEKGGKGERRRCDRGWV